MVQPLALPCTLATLVAGAGSRAGGAPLSPVSSWPTYTATPWLCPVTGQFGETMGHALTSANLTLKASAVVFVQQETNELPGRSEGSTTFTSRWSSDTHVIANLDRLQFQ